MNRRFRAEAVNPNRSFGEVATRYQRAGRSIVQSVGPPTNGCEEESISLEGNPDFDQFSWAFADLAMIDSYEGDFDGAVAHLRAGANSPADQPDRFCLAFMPYFLTVCGRGDEARSIADEIVSQVEATGNPSSISLALWGKGKAFAGTDPDTAQKAYRRALAIAREAGIRSREILIAADAATLFSSRATQSWRCGTSWTRCRFGAARPTSCLSRTVLAV